MGKGISLFFKEVYPENFRTYGACRALADHGDVRLVSQCFGNSPG